MQKLDRATLIELAWRDFFFWPVARPVGVLFYFLISPVVRLLVVGMNMLASLFDPHRPLADLYDHRTILHEIFTIANVVTVYGLFLWSELVYLIWAWHAGYESVKIVSFSSWFFDIHAPSIVLIAVLGIEILVTDLIDGPLARVNNAVTALGTLLDHIRDYLTAAALFVFLIILAIGSGDVTVLILLLGAFAGFLLVIIHYLRLWKTLMKNRGGDTRGQKGSRSWNHFLFVRNIALNEYQTRLTGRIQFGAMALGAECGLFYFGTGYAAMYTLFIIGLSASMMATSYYLYELWGEYYQKWQENMRERSDELKEKFVEKITERRER